MPSGCLVHIYNKLEFSRQNRQNLHPKKKKQIFSFIEIYGLGLEELANVPQSVHQQKKIFNLKNEYAQTNYFDILTENK